MKEVLGILFLALMSLASCVQGGNNPTYIISEHSKLEQAPAFEEEEAR